MRNFVYKKHLGKDRHKLEMAPMVDIVFQLLIFFLVATEMRPTEADFKTNLPGQGKGPTDREKKKPPIPARIYMSAEGDGSTVNVSLNQVSIGKMQAEKGQDVLQGRAFAELERRLKDAKATAGEQLMVVIGGDKNVKTKFIAGALDAAVAAEAPRISFGRPRDD